METTRNISLRDCNSFNLNISAKTLVTLENIDEAAVYFSGLSKDEGPFLLLGSGSNMLFINDYQGAVIRSGIRYIRSLMAEDDHIIVKAGSGVLWDDLVAYCVANGYGGIENLSFIPGTVGAAAVQNIGAYGSEVKDCIEKVTAISTFDGSIVEFNNTECGFGYRDSVFKNELKQRYFITEVSLRLSTKPVYNTVYGSLATEVGLMGGPNLVNIRNAVIAIRQSKLPDPSVLGNAGSFFKNPFISAGKAKKLNDEFPQVPLYYNKDGTIKVAAAWLIEKCGWKGYRSGDAGVDPRQALIIINYGEASGSEIYALSEKIRKSVLERFEINLEREVEVINAI